VASAGWLGSSGRQPASPRRGSLGSGGVALRASTPATPSGVTCFSTLPDIHGERDRSTLLIIDLLVFPRFYSCDIVLALDSILAASPLVVPRSWRTPLESTRLPSLGRFPQGSHCRAHRPNRLLAIARTDSIHFREGGASCRATSHPLPARAEPRPPVLKRRSCLAPSASPQPRHHQKAWQAPVRSSHSAPLPDVSSR
jgi:hypothetical protein